MRDESPMRVHYEDMSYSAQRPSGAPSESELAALVETTPASGPARPGT